MQANLVTQNIKGWRKILARSLECIVGSILIYAAYTKSWDTAYFSRQIAAFGIITSLKITLILAWIFIVLEYLFGAALLVGLKRKIFLPATFGLFVAFCVALLWAWVTGSAEDCGCFGTAVKRSPAEALVEDLVLIFGMLVAYILDREETSTLQVQRYAAVTLITLSGLSFAVYENSKAASEVKLQIKTKSIFDGLKIEGLSERPDFSTGTHLVVLIDTGCDHCQAAVPALNTLFRQSLPLLALCLNTEQEVTKFRKDFNAEFPIGRITEAEFLKLLGNGMTPRLFLLRNGETRKVWEGNVPEIKEILQASNS
ncbi:MAG: hypothetical protein RMM17_07665 [Acidobacteriota bacterium]|nr:hypothetical protein [Blastocatellia bacterium]MDW8412543.1 hypothetical protein [Acidobacteriota bacterium]